MLMDHLPIHGPMHEAALKGDKDPDRLSFLDSVRVVQLRVRCSAFRPRDRKLRHEAILAEFCKSEHLKPRSNPPPA